ncbi:MAG: AbrB/MazE/SpoVT family DNA-binding domain-containing protein [Chloroflexi bacterium]|nr:AbrB/MazE/SpoVT family DNA-binding domain-containing protein [Chloroflexota bacterium]
MAVRVKVSNKNQIAVPAEVRKKLQIKSGDYLLVEIRDGSVVLVPEPQDYSQHLRGLHREIWQGSEPQAYVQQEREGWQH